MITAFLLMVATATTGAEVTVHLHNEAKVAARAFRDAVEVAGQAFRQARIPVRWVDCGAEPAGACKSSGPGIYELVVANPAGPSASTTGGTFTMGYSLIVPGTPAVYAKVLLPRVMQYAEFADVRVSSALGYAIAHEVAHLVLGTNHHGNFGILKARWSRSDSRLIAGSRLKFHDGEVKRMREALGR